MTSPGGTSVFARLLDLFRVDGRWSVPILLAFAMVNLIVLWNAIAHDPRFGYDAPGHIAYVRTLAAGGLPTPQDSHEFFSPPLPYVPAALAWRILDGSLNDTRQIVALKVAQFGHVLASLIVCWSLLAIAKLVRGDAWMRVASLVALGMVPAYYRTFAMVRGEPWMAALLLLGAYHVLKAFAIDRPTLGRAIVAGLLLGGAVLSRQWAFFALPVLGLIGLWRLVGDPENRLKTLACGAALLACAAVSGGWYYAHLHHTYGSMRAFNRPPAEEEPSVESFHAAGSLLSAMVRAPVRDAFDNHPVWLFYSDTWGDYWRYYLVYARDQKGRLVKPVLAERLIDSGKSKSSNLSTMPEYLGRVCAVSIVPTACLLIGLGYGFYAARRVRVRADGGSTFVLPALAFMVFATLLGYGWFVATYPNDHLDTVKASYPLQIFPLLAICASAMWCALHDRRPLFARMVGTAVLLVLLHNLPAMFTRYTLI